MNVSKEEVDKLNNEISRYRRNRRAVIKTFEVDLVTNIEDQVVSILEKRGFTIIDHQFNRWVSATKSGEILRVWFSIARQPSNGHYTIKCSYKDVTSTISIMVHHKFSNSEHNYLSCDYIKILEKKVQELTQELNELKELKFNDIDGTYVAYVNSEKEIKPLSSFSDCFESFLNLDIDKV